MKLRVLLSILALILVPIARGNSVFIFFITFYPLSLLFSREATRIWLRKWFLAFAIILVLVIPVLSPSRDAEFFFISYSREMLILGLQMTAKAVVFFVWLRILVTSYTPHQILRFFERAGMKDLGVKVTVAMNILPLLAESIRISWEALRMRRRRLDPKFFFYFARTIIVNTVRMAEDLALASYLKGYGVGDDLDRDR